jgi:predicted PurR-regulated permease PerM
MADTQNTLPSAIPVIEIIIKISVLVFLVGWCFLILKPFISPVVWGAIMAVAAYPLFSALAARLGGRPKLAAAAMTLVALLIIILPGLKLAVSAGEGMKYLTAGLQDGSLHVPAPPPTVGQWPVVGPSIATAWGKASANLTAALAEYRPLLETAAGWLLKKSLNTGLGVLMFALSMVIAGIFLAGAESGGNVARALLTRLAGSRGIEFAADAVVTVRNVVKGILGVAVIQALAAGIGFGIAGVPMAGLWTFFCLILAIVQIGVGPVAVPVIIYMFAKAGTLKAVVLSLWLVLVMLSDNVLKPMLLGRGAPVPMAVIFLGAIGGFMSMGFLGLFLGALVLTVGYKLFKTWLGAGDEAGPEGG